MTSPTKQARVGSVWVALPADFELSRVGNTQTFERLKGLFGCKVDAFRRAIEAPTYNSVEEWRNGSR